MYHFESCLGSVIASQMASGGCGRRRWKVSVACAPANETLPTWDNSGLAIGLTLPSDSFPVFGSDRGV